MGCSSVKEELKISKSNKPLYDAYLSFKNIYLSIKNDKESILEVFLISAKSISNFIRCIKQTKVINELIEQNNESFESLNILLKKFDEYKLEENIEFYYDYEISNNICQNNDNNEFIIVNKTFVDNMIIDKKDIDTKKVKLYIDKINKNKITFQNSDKYINFEETDFSGLFKFVLDNDNIDNDNDNNNRNSVNQNNRNPSLFKDPSLINPIINILNRNSNSIINLSVYILLKIKINNNQIII